MTTVKPLTEREIKYIQSCINKCTTREEFIRKYSVEFVKIKRRGLRKKLLGHFKKKKRGVWTLQKVRKTASKYRTRSSFCNKDPNAYSFALKAGILDQVCSHMIRVNKIYNVDFKRWLIKEVKKCKTKVNFCIHHKSIYTYIMNNKKDLIYILDGLEKFHYTNNSVGEESLRFFLNDLLKCDFKKMKPDWLINPKTGRHLELDGYDEKNKIAFEHNSKYHKGKEYIDDIKVQKCKEKGITLMVFPDIRNELSFVDLKDLTNIIEKNVIKHGVRIQNPSAKFEWKFIFSNKRWNVDKLKKLANKYSLLKQFIKENKGAYIAICRLKMNQEILGHMLKNQYKSKYTDEKLLRRALAYPSLNQFRVSEPKYYSALKKRKSLREKYKQIKTKSKSSLN